MLRASAVIMAVYVGMLGLTWWQFYRTPTGFIPQQDKGYLVLNVELPNSASLERTEKVMAQIEETVRGTPGVAHTIGISGQSLILNANAPNLGSFYVLLDEFHKRSHEGTTPIGSPRKSSAAATTSRATPSWPPSARRPSTAWAPLAAST
jgi:multidrug efflux pump